MNKVFCQFLFFLCLSGVTHDLQAQVSRQLNIPGRLQWDNANGYCGEESIQMIGLYYGNYISQDICRKVAGGELLIGNDNGEDALNKLSFTYETWDFNQPVPQYQKYLVWVKQHLYYYHPVIITCFVKDMDEPDYDHIIPAIGFTATDLDTFNGTDNLMFNDCYERSYYTRSFQSIWDSRSMSGNGSVYEYCIQKNVDYGVAVTGIKDEQNVTEPVHLSIDRWDEPNVTRGRAPVLLNAVITIESLTIGDKYALLRFDHYANVPSSGFDPAGASSVVYFTASGTSQTFSGSFMSNTAVFYRCIPYNFISGTENLIVEQEFYRVFPNPATDYISIESIANSTIEVFNCLGERTHSLVQTKPICTIDLRNSASGMYTIRINDGKSVTIRKVIVQ